MLILPVLPGCARAVPGVLPPGLTAELSGTSCAAHQRVYESMMTHSFWKRGRKWTEGTSLPDVSFTWCSCVAVFTQIFVKCHNQKGLQRSGLRDIKPLDKHVRGAGACSCPQERFRVRSDGAVAGPTSQRRRPRPRGYTTCPAVLRLLAALPTLPPASSGQKSRAAGSTARSSPAPVFNVSEAPLSGTRLRLRAHFFDQQ
ncbi:hypothetical protein CB1_000327055 [Camelus ferus]|nr:hypothetical protein CB1_000327055 [Camelus ferus]